MHKRKNEDYKSRLRLKFFVSFAIIICGIGLLFIQDYYAEMKKSQRALQLLKYSEEAKLKICDKLISGQFLKETKLNCRSNNQLIKLGFDHLISDLEIELTKEINFQIQTLNKMTLFDLSKFDQLTFRDAYHKGHTMPSTKIDSEEKWINYSREPGYFYILNAEFYSNWNGNISARDPYDKIVNDSHTAFISNYFGMDIVNTEKVFFSHSPRTSEARINERLYKRLNFDMTKNIFNRKHYTVPDLSIKNLCRTGCSGDIYYTTVREYPHTFLQHVTVKSMSDWTVRKVIEQFMDYHRLEGQDTLLNSFIVEKLDGLLYIKRLLKNIPDRPLELKDRI